MNDPIRRLASLTAFLFAALLIASTWIQSIGSADINNRSDNRRTLLNSYNRERGQILVDGEPIARSTATKDELKWQRTYSSPQLYSHVTGFYSFVYGTGGGVEDAENALLSGQSDKLFYGRVTDLLTGRRAKGASVELTIDPAVQRAASEALGDQRGAVVALDPRTGEILAMVSKPNYDPSLLATHDVTAQQEAWTELNGDPTRPLVNRAIGGNLYPPGSTFKIVTAAAAIESGTFTKDSTLPGPAELDLPQTTTNLPNSHPGACGPNNKTTLLQALETSCNTAFGWLGMELGAETLADQASRFGFGDRLDIPMRVADSTFPADADEPQTAQSAIGQFEVRTTPLQVAMIAAAVANDGVVMRPHMVRSILGSDTSVLEEKKVEQLSEAMSPETADALTDMMQAVVESGTGTAAQIPGVAVAGKTGTAEHAKDAAPHAWFTAFAPADDPQVAVAVVVEDGGKAGSEAYGGTVAGPIAKAVMEAVINP
ncbi:MULTISPECIES: peptidoglycan D,D-transpeptidase FtsI family protein [unclassified Janibacter]|uniref:peptidoglycan D,D-transpeptidase FtsI family protein n=1 Tax=unclassified Janibacter TaxID=2649294 RepID=UPI003CFD2692